ncbi:DUF4982 domain-containing protein, partial [Paraflavisolibacter sp. H34]|uniref:DUF4982 domain-containing protein n=1 Tax=Huijunlia imazamoxiresistens TaxID=3127457 RepID=UPI0030172411
RGAENFRRSGEVDALRIKKDNFYAHQVMWDGWVDVEKPRLHIIGHWNYTPEVKKDIFVISSADKVELKVNGKSLGFGEQSNRFLYTFKNVQWQPGAISAVGYDAGGKPLCSDEIKTAGKPAALRLKAMTAPAGLKADGHDLALIEVEVVDAGGQRCPTALDMVRFELDGPAEWRGGMAQGPDNYILSQNLPVECGVNRVLVRSRTQAGTITLKAAADGLKGASLTLTSKAFPVTGGLTTVLPSAGLPSQLKRGPTPLTPSFKVSRNAIGIVRATAGANADSAFASIDDNELSDWYNDGNL